MTRHERRKAAGLCLSCESPPAPSKTMCRDCLRRMADRDRQRRRRRSSAGLCRLCERPAKAGFKACSEHLDVARARKAARDRAHRAAALCVTCGASLAPRSASYCSRHLEEHRTKSTSKRAELRGVQGIYFIQSGDGGPIKIGWTGGLGLRLWALQVGNPEQLRVLASYAAGRDEELRLHDRFRHLHIRGEWHHPGLDLLAFISTIAGGE